MLSDKQWLELYTSSVENRKDIIYIKDTLEDDRRDIRDCQLKVNALEVNQGVQKGKVAFLAVSIAALLTVLTNAALWLFSHAGGGK
jgi:hypothetical protein